MNQFFETRLPGVPAKFLLGLGRVAEELLDFRWTEVFRIDFHEDFARFNVDALFVDAFAFPAEFDAGLAEREGAELADGMVLAGGDHEVVGLRLLEDEPHTFDVVAGVAPVAQGVQVAQVQLVLESLRDARRREGDLAGHERLAPALALVVEEDAVAAVHSVALAVVLHYPEAVEFRDAIRAARVKRRRLLLRDFLHETEEFRGRGLVDAAGVGQAGDAHRLEEAEHAERVGVGRKLRHVEGNFDVALGRQIVDLVGPDFHNDPDQARAVGHIAPMQIHETLLLHIPDPFVQVQVFNPSCVERRTPPHNAVDLIALLD